MDRMPFYGGKGPYTLFPGQEVFSMQKEAVDKMVLHFVTAPFLP